MVQFALGHNLISVQLITCERAHSVHLPAASSLNQLHQLHTYTVFPLLYLKKGPRPVCEWLVYENADSCNSGFPTVSSKILVHVFYSSCACVHSTCTHSSLQQSTSFIVHTYIVTIQVHIAILSKPAKILIMANMLYPIILFHDILEPPCLNSLLEEQ